MPINIHGKQYVTVAERVHEAGADFLGLSTEVLTHSPVVVRATVTTKKGSFTGISAANPAKTLEKQSPYEIAETSAVGRALGFAGYGSVEGIASADEMLAAGEKDPTDDWVVPNKSPEEPESAQKKAFGKCPKCGADNIIYKTSGKLGCSAYCWKNK